ncbi:MAG: hypothetical protein KAI44_03615 [Methylococcales bacterium]|nr:hypothetical protein [Methylococcales bacterium]
MKTQTKCTLSLSGLFILGLLPIPFTAIYCLYVIRKRPGWFPETVKRLYAEKEKKQDITIDPALLDGYDPIVTRRRCTISLSLMVLLDILIPFIPLFGLYIVRRRPIWFKNVVDLLYADQLDENEVIEDFLESFDSNSISSVVLEKKYIALQKSNIEFALQFSAKAR